MSYDRSADKIVAGDESSIVLAVELNAGGRLAGQIESVVDDGIIDKTTRDLDHVVAPLRHGGQRVFHEQLEGVVAGEADLLRDLIPGAGQAHVGRSIGIDSCQNRDHHPGPGRDRKSARARTSARTSNWPSAEMAARPALEENPIGAFRQNHFGIVDAR